MHNVFDLILIIVFLVMTYSFANLSVGRKKGDAQIISQLKDENNKLKITNNKLQSDLDHIRDHKVEKILNKKVKFTNAEKEPV